MLDEKTVVQRSSWKELNGKGPNWFSYEGEQFGVCGSGFFTDYHPGQSTPLHRHPYPEIFTVVEGVATFFADDDYFTAEAGDVIVVPAGMVHRFENSGEGRLLVASVHSSPRVEQENLE